MGTAIDTSVGIVGYLALFAGVGFTFIFVNLLVGKFLRPANPHAEKLEIYECGEPAIGSSFVQFDLRFYVVALVFIIFDVEVAFLFPWATVFGKVNHLLREPAALVETVDGAPQLTAHAAGVYRELGETASVVLPAGDAATAEQILRQGKVAADGTIEWAGLQQLLEVSAVAVAIFFVVLLVGFAYEWRTGALDWVRAMTRPSVTPPAGIRPTGTRSQESVLSA